MAEEKKTGLKLDAFEEMVVIFFVLAILGVISERLLNLIEGRSVLSSIMSGALSDFFHARLLPILKIIGFLVSGASFVGIIYAIRNLTRINTALNAIYNPPIPAGLSKGDDSPLRNIRWEKILVHLRSDNPNDWKFAIIEADIVLNDMLDAMGYRGETIADKLKNVEESDFHTVDAAWEAHKVRNMIAHEGANFAVTEREVRRVIDLYRQVFEEFNFI
ncbi:MAG: hypothetical protein A2653_00250 [Candidatus Zambryskibacteria bacterium RIFCSPHIGHO2_01_FULL_43_25]|uniref:RiboL-PSP-HEPN domain-containing protein n=1 Tax=Candidatus Zambryskibacteria bacterium RIFCSPLOWO2_01_FULL_45_21 TaxID=1802761 RepID=A0A1G2U677_9BACT|nr:MAG: hypothetical protein A2653_00250 [Candidatus Zambryskibacteria bacterium RIFCSPHIGHO2_01_FULL_43_25]OHB00665.1 MAG: hypothetical protein A3E94_03505 [Candidatus Zambryskibacteria bacterium RIFCSPHIGHO2_12_FULL_44_12b]OHB04480.1 MAG: hypothetical protein A3B14_03545 [Candidatus Zambryskibacteria bacterium RIFCSPLOWO2_01_FULL_45_21]